MKKKKLTWSDREEVERHENDNEELFEEKILRCIECGSKACICEADDNQWAAHCMKCDNAIGNRGVYDPCASSREDAIRKWNKLNEN